MMVTARAVIAPPRARSWPERERVEADAGRREHDVQVVAAGRGPDGDRRLLPGVAPAGARDPDGADDGTRQRVVEAQGQAGLAAGGTDPDPAGRHRGTEVGLLEGDPGAGR